MPAVQVFFVQKISTSRPAVENGIGSRDDAERFQKILWDFAWETRSRASMVPTPTPLRRMARMLSNRKPCRRPDTRLGLSPTAIAVHKRHATLVDHIKDALLRARIELRPTTHRRFAFARVQLYGGDSILRRLRGLCRRITAYLWGPPAAWIASPRRQRKPSVQAKDRN